MDRLHLLLVIVASAVLLASTARAADPAAGPPSTALRVMSFNVRNSNAHDGDNAWKFRKALFFKTIRAFDPDLLGMQEVLADQYDAVHEALPDYTLIGVARDDGHRKGEWSCIAVRSTRFTVLDSGNFWLSDTPDKVGSVGWDAALTRICTWAKLHDKLADRDFVYANTHFDHVGKQARTNSAKLLATKLPELAGNQPIILTGDFNSTEDTPAYHTLTHMAEHGGAQLIDSYRETHPDRQTDEASFHGFKGTIAGSRIDWILHTPELKATAATIDRAKSDDGHYPSDHYPVTATLEWK
jgi:endonuclease/exonuclease/phosphatase family metal-dependent hydrolase